MRPGRWWAQIGVDAGFDKNNYYANLHHGGVSHRRVRSDLHSNGLKGFSPPVFDIASDRPF